MEWGSGDTKELGRSERRQSEDQDQPSVHKRTQQSMKQRGTRGLNRFACRGLWLVVSLVDMLQRHAGVLLPHLCCK